MNTAKQAKKRSKRNIQETQAYKAGVFKGGDIIKGLVCHALNHPEREKALKVLALRLDLIQSEDGKYRYKPNTGLKEIEEPEIKLKPEKNMKFYNYDLSKDKVQKATAADAQDTNMNVFAIKGKAKRFYVGQIIRVKSMYDTNIDEKATVLQLKGGLPYMVKLESETDPRYIFGLIIQLISLVKEIILAIKGWFKKG